MLKIKTEIYCRITNTIIKINKMDKKILFIAVLLFNSLIVNAQVNKDSIAKLSDINIQNAAAACLAYGYLDNDRDGYGVGPRICLDDVIGDEDNHYTKYNGDCDDYDNTIFPRFWFYDGDGDGVGIVNNPLTKLCYPPNSSFVATAGDCDDTNPAIIYYTWYRDADGDGLGNPNEFIIVCPQITGYVSNNTDCNDSSNTILSTISWYYDGDGDGFGINNGTPIIQCNQPSLNHVSNNADCNDNEISISSPVIFYYDGDGDSFGDPNITTTACSQPANYVTNNLDACPTTTGSLQGCLVPNPATSFGDRNYIITTTPKVAVTNIQNITQAKDVVVNITYFDDLGKPNQQIANQQSNTGKDIITHIKYDNYNRQEQEFLPFASTSSNMTFDSSAELNTLGYQDYNGQFPFSKKQFESSPLNRVFKQAAPGTTSDWAMGSGHEIKFDYLTNTSADAVKLFVATASWNTTNTNDFVYNIALTETGTTNYADNQLIKTVTKDENWTSGKNNTTEEFKDKEGKVILKRTYSNYLETGQFEVSHDTYYVYDQYNNLTYVIPPLVTNVTTQLDGLCYQYKYDNRNRLVEKKLPGKQWEFIVYDKLDRVVATGPALSPFSLDNTSGWMITKYDALNRPILTAWKLEAGTFSSAIRKALQTSYNLPTSILNEAKGTTDMTINLISFRYTNVAYPATTDYHILTVNYYDDYNFSFITTAPIPTATVEGQTVYYNNTTKPKGIITGTWVRVLETSNDTKAERTVIFYDEKARAIRTKKTNHLDGYTQVDTNFQSITGRTNYTVTYHKKDLAASPALITVKDEFTYSDQDRLTKQTQEINNSGVKQLIASNTYNELGELTSKYIGGSNTTGTTGLQKVNFKYNIRGWLTDINDVANLSNGSDPQDLFAFKINYNIVQDQLPGYTGIRLYNGNISETYWVTASDYKLRKYGYKYDNINRLKDAVYMRPGTTFLGNYNESLTYDKNGNITTLYRTGENENPSATDIDALTYGYEANTNKLIKVDDASGFTAGFKDGPSLTNEYAYDTFGNMTKDFNKGINTDITYNHLSLPKKIILPLGNITYIYNALGQKISKVVAVTSSSSSTTTNYLDGFQYTANTLDYFPHAEGYVTQQAGVYKYVFQYKDHLGNVRISFKEGTIAGTTTATDIIEENHYYPFGLKHNGYNYTINGGVTYATGNKYKYNGKELQEELGLNMYDYGARNYDPAIGRWINPDELSEDFSDTSPYVYAFNDPIRYTDPDGNAPEDIILRGKNNSSLTIKTDIVDISLNVSSLGIDFEGNHTLTGDDILEAALDIGGVVDQTGIIDGAAAVFHGNNGDWGNALISGLSIAPGLDVVKIGKIPKHLKTIDKAIDAVKAQQRAEKLSKVERVGKNFTKAGKEAVIDVNKAKNAGKVKCATCGTKTVPATKSKRGVTPSKKERQVDHKKAKSKGGSGTPDNGQVLCRECNIKKSNN
jgi:RHS repeat-associated protein